MIIYQTIVSDYKFFCVIFKNYLNKSREKTFLALQLLCALMPSQNIKNQKGVKVATH
jgi:hypothetical protein